MAFNIAQTSRLGRRLLHSSARALSAAAAESGPSSVASSAASTSASPAAAANTSSFPSSASAAASSTGPYAVRPSVPLLPRHDIQVGPTQQNRYEEHYNNTLARDMLYMTYEHGLDLKMIDEAEMSKLNGKARTHTWDPSSPYTKNRPERANKGNRPTSPKAANYADQVVELERIVITSFSQESILNKQALIPLVAIMRAITGKPVIEAASDPQLAQGGSGLPKSGYVRLVYSKKNVQAFKLRKGMACGVQAVLPRKSAYRFLEVLTTFVLPRMRGFNGFLLPPPSQAPTHSSAVSGVVSLGMDKEAFGLFPQTEVNWDNYPFKPLGFQVDCITNQRGARATEKARQLLSGLGVPFVRRGEQ